MPYTRVWSKNIPAGSRDAKEIDDAIREFREDVEERIAELATGWSTASPTDPIVPKGSAIFTSGQTTTTSTTEVSVASYSITASKFVSNGDRIRVNVVGSADVQNCTILLKFGATIIISRLITADNVFELDAVITKQGVNTQIGHGTVKQASILGVDGAFRMNRVAPAENESATILLDVRGNVVVGGTLRVDSWSVEFLKA